MKPEPRKGIISSATPDTCPNGTMSSTSYVALGSKVYNAFLSLRPTRPMKFPYTFTAKVVQFPFKFYYQKNWIFKYYPWGIIGSIPLFMYFSSLANSPNNKAVWAEKRRKEREEHRH